MKFIIKRNTWRNGSESIHAKGIGNTKLLNSSGYMCCLGQCIQQIDNSLELLNIAEPDEVDIDISDKKEDLYIFINKDNPLLNTELADDAMLINDSIYTTSAAKEVKLIKLFAEYGHKIEFIN